ncbi:MAG: hypothetical protein WCG96_00230 [Actinomycetes bacterium]
MGFLVFPVFFVVVWGLFDALLGSPWGLVLSTLCGVVVPGLILAGAMLEDRDREREIASLRSDTQWPTDDRFP